MVAREVQAKIFGIRDAIETKSRPTHDDPAFRWLVRELAKSTMTVDVARQLHVPHGEVVAAVTANTRSL